MKKKLLIFHPALAPYRVDFFNALGKQFCCKIIFLTHNNANQNFNQNILLTNATFEYDYLNKHFVILKRNVNLGYWKMIKDFNPDIVICCEFGLSLLSTYLYKKLHLKATFTLFTISDDSDKMVQVLQGIRKRLVTFFCKRIDGIVVTNSDVSKYYEKSFGTKRTYYFPIINDDTIYRQKIVRALPISESYIEKYALYGKKVFLFVGRLVDKIKNVSALLEAYHNIDPNLREKSKLVIVGSGDDLGSLKDKCQKLGLDNYVIFAGRYESDELLAWYSIADFLVLPSLYEPFGAVTSEALQAGARAMISCNAGSKCLIDETNGIVFNPEDKNEFSSLLTNMLYTAQPITTPLLRPNRLHMRFEDLILKLSGFLHAKN